MWRLGAVALMLVLAGGLAQAQSEMDEVWQPLVESLVQDGFDAQATSELFASQGVEFDPGVMGRKMKLLYEREFDPPRDEPEPEEPRQRLTIYDIHLTAEKIADIIVFKWEHKDLLAQIEEDYGVEGDVIVAILVVETKLGEYLGEQTALVSLASMAVSDNFSQVQDYLSEYSPTQEQADWIEDRQRGRSEWAYNELKELLLYTQENSMDPVTMPGSVYGAIGLCQFLPTNARALGIDGDQDGTVDLFNPIDAAHSVANFLKDAGWTPDLDRESKIRVLRRYNNDEFYARTILSIARRI